VRSPGTGVGFAAGLGASACARRGALSGGDSAKYQAMAPIASTSTAKAAPRIHARRRLRRLRWRRKRL